MSFAHEKDNSQNLNNPFKLLFLCQNANNYAFVYLITISMHMQKQFCTHK